MSDDSESAFPAATIEALLAPAVGRLAPNTSLSPLPYDLNAGVPDRATLPADGLLAAMQRALDADAAGALTYGGQQGYEPLRAWIAARESQEGALDVTSAQVTLTSGSAHGIDNIAATFVGEGDIVVVGAPTYPGAIRTFRARGATIIESPQDDDGLIPSALARVLDTRRMTGQQAKLLYIQPNYDNPSGATLPVERRSAIVALCRQHGVLIVEDDAYTGIDLDGPPPPSMFAIAGGRGVMRVGTFSKTVATGLRVALITSQPEIVQKLVFMRFDNGASPLLHRMVLEYLRSGEYEPHVEGLRDLYRERRDASADALREFTLDRRWTDGTLVRIAGSRAGQSQQFRIEPMLGLQEGMLCEAHVQGSDARGKHAQYLEINLRGILQDFEEALLWHDADAGPGQGRNVR